MHLKSLTLRGFKSFADTTTLDFEPGITVVVGPNGSGKSNVVDAVAWVLGAQGPRTLRSSKMDDVIFAGTASRPALGRAEVSLTIDNTSGVLPIDFAEVTISRTLFRNGASEYAINQVPCRLLDVQELLSDSGVGRTQHVIVGQGQLEAVLEARPEERRAIIEEAAGVLKFRRRKEKAERRLASTEANLVRLGDLAREVGRQLRPLERQAEAAGRHRDLRTELDAIRLHLAGRELAALAGRQAAGEDTSDRLAGQEAALRAELSGLDLAAEAAQRELVTSGADGLAELVARAERLREQARGLAAVLAERRRGVARDRTAAVDETVVATLEDEASRVAAELSAAEEAAAGLAPEIERLVEGEADLAAELARLGPGPGGREGPEPPSGPGARLREARAAAAGLGTALERADAELARARLRSQALQERRRLLEVERQELSERLDLSRRRHDQARARQEAAADERSRAEDERSRGEASLRAADARRHAWSARADALAAALDEARARAGAERLAGRVEVAGAIPELVDVDSGWEAAFEASMGAALAAVAVEGGAEAARACLARLRDAGPGREPGAGSVLELGLDRPASARPEVGEAVRDHVRPRRPDVGPLLDALLASAVCVGGAGPEAWHEALDTARDHPGAVVVTRAGDRFAADGWRVGGQAAGPTRGALEEARRHADAAATEAAGIEGEVTRVGEALEQARAAEADATREVQEQAAAVAATDASSARVVAEAKAVAVEVADVASQLAALAATVDRDRDRLDEVRATLPGLEAAALEAQARHQAAQAERHRLDERADALRALRRDVEIRATALDERRGWLRDRLAQVESRLAGNRAARARAEVRRVELDRALVAIDGLSGLVASHLVALEALLDDLRERRRRQSERTRAHAQHLDELRRRRAGLEQRLEQVRAQVSRAAMEVQELCLRRDAAVEALRRDLDAGPEDAAAAPCPPLPEGTSARSRARELEGELRLLGPINPLAVEEARALRERREFLDGQLDDVKASRRELAKVIRSVDAEIVEVFVAAFADVAHNFSRLFGLLFPGGQGSLELTDPSDPLRTGIQVRARPPGKNVRSIALLSGGERSLCALAYLFAVFRSRPSPFYVLDEVEAALDDVNLHRFLDLVGEFRGEAQLLVVSHQQRTMETADVLYGVTMAPGGASGVVSERMATAVG